MDYTYIDKFPKPLLEDIVKNKCIPIIGAGFSLNANIPPNKEMLLWGQLANKLADDLTGYPKSSPIDLISAYEHEFTRSKLIERLSELLLIDIVKPGRTHIALCGCQFDIVATTNFDFLLEQGYEQVRKYCYPIIEEEQLSIGVKEAQVTLLKIHGDLRHPNRLVATENDYDLFLDRNPLLATFLANLLITRTPLLVGYSLEDPDFRHIWQIIGNRLGHLRRPAYVLTVGVTPSDIARYERRGVKVINLPGIIEDYPTILEGVFTEIERYWSNELLNISTITEENSLANLSLPSDATNHLCYLAIPNRLLSFYRTMVFPLILRYGFTPITVEDVISPGESVSAKMAAILSRADVVIADPESSWVAYELSKTSKSAHVLIIEDGDHHMNTLESNWSFVSRPQKDFWESEDFLGAIENWLERVSEELQPKFSDEPNRLLNKGEYRAAVISALSLLELTLRRFLESASYRSVGIPPSVSQVVRSLGKQDLLSKQTVNEVMEWIKTRNYVIHTGMQIDKVTAEKIVSGVNTLVTEIQPTLNQVAVGTEDILKGKPESSL